MSDINDYVLIIFSVFIVLPLAQLIFKFLPKPITKRKPALPGRGWKIIYTDNASANEERKPGVVYGKLLADKRRRVYGKPDFIYSNGHKLMPVELKSGKIKESSAPRDGDLMQLAVYFHLAEAEYGLKAPKGLLIYSDAMFVVRNTRQLSGDLMNTVTAMQEMLDGPPENMEEVDAEPSFVKCRYCSCRGTVCDR